jgi:hypothetical protein
VKFGRPKELRDVRQLGWPISQMVDLEWRQEEEKRAEADEIAGRAALQFGIPKSYLRSRMHDGAVLRLHARSSRFYLEVGDIEYETLANVLQRRLSRTQPIPNMPAAYDFRDCDFITVYYVEETGRLLPASLGRAERLATQFVYNSIAELKPERLVSAFSLWCPFPWKRDLTSPVIVVSSASPRLEVLHRPAWEKCFGPDWLWVYERFRDVHEEVVLHSWHAAEEFLDSIGVAAKV